MSSLNLDLLEISDEQALAALEAISKYGKDNGATNLSGQMFVLDGEPGASLPLGQLRERAASILQQEGYLFRRLVVSFQLPNSGSVTASFQRQQNGTALATLNLEGQLDRDPASALRTDLALKFSQAFGPFHRRKIFAHLPPEIEEFYTRRESTLVRLEELATKGAENLEAHRQRLDQAFEARRRDLEADLKDRAEHSQQELRSMLDGLAAKEEALVKREEELEKADNTHARRRLRQDLKSALKERHTKFTLTADTERKRSPIVAAFIVLGLVTLAAAGYFAWLASKATSEGMLLTWSLWLRVGLSLAGFGGSAVYFIRWQDRWAQAHADEEFRLKRLDLDVDRASWLVEVLLEWRGAAGGDIPQELIDKLANGLFEPHRTYPYATHPVEDAITSLLASPASLKLKLPGGEVNLDKKAIDRAKSVSAE